MCQDSSAYFSDIMSTQANSSSTFAQQEPITPQLPTNMREDFFNLQGLSWSSGYFATLCFGIHSFSCWLKTATLPFCLSQLRSGKVGMHLLENLYQLLWTATWVNRNPNHRATGLIIYIRETEVCVWSEAVTECSFCPEGYLSEGEHGYLGLPSPQGLQMSPWTLPLRRIHCSSNGLS
jgi:hypothetical protein